MKTSTVVWIIIVLIIVIGGGWYAYSSHGLPATSTQTPGGTGAIAPNQVTVTYGPNGFTPSTVTIKKGDIVVFVASGDSKMWVASDPHPVHTGYDGTSMSQHCAAGYAGAAPFDQCATGPTFGFTFSKVGSWGYHNHSNHNDTGTIIVQ